MRNTIENNRRRWDEEHKWRRGGNEWVGQAKASGQPYRKWKRSVVRTFIAPNVRRRFTVLEIGPGRGRWSRKIAERCRELILVDLSPSCIDHCRELFGEDGNVTYVVGDGRSLPGVADGSVDFVWSYDAFVHMDPGTIAAYFAEIERVLRPGGKAVIHHSGRRHRRLRLRFLRHLGKWPARLYTRLSLEQPDDPRLRELQRDGGWRADVSKRMVKELAAEAGLKVKKQVRWWGENKEFGVPRYGDWIATLRKPNPARQRRAAA